MLFNRRQFMQVSALGLLFPYSLYAQNALITKKIPSSNIDLPVIGMGTWITFNVGEIQSLKTARTEILKEFLNLGGGMVDSSPMYGSAEAVVGHGLQSIKTYPSLFSATKIWTSSQAEGRKQVDDSLRLWKLKSFDLMQIHNLDGWEGHLKTLAELKKSGVVKHIGITTSHGRRHSEFADIMRKHPLDFIQVTYNIMDREVEKTILPLAKEKGIAVIANRPFQGGSLINRLKTKPLPTWAKTEGISTWPKFLLKYIVSHPSVHCAIPATSKLEHLRENMKACYGKLPSQEIRVKMEQYVATL